MSPTGPGTFHWFGASLELVGTPTPTLTVGDSNTHTFSGVIGGITHLVKQGSGTQILSGNNTYTGGTTVSQGALRMGNAAALGSGDVSIAAGAKVLLWWNSGSSTVANNFTLNGIGAGVDAKSAIYADGGGAGYGEYTLSGTITLNATSNVGGWSHAGASNNLNLTGRITGPGGLTKGGTWGDETNAVILANPANDYAGHTTVASGTLRLGASEVIPHGPGNGGVTVQAGAALDLGAYDETINSLSGSGSVVWTGVTRPVYFTTNAGSDVSASKTYPHLLDFIADGSAATVNAVAFTAAGNSGPDWSLTGATSSIAEASGAASAPSFPDAPDGAAMNQLYRDFHYNGNPAVLTLTGLTAGVTYETRFYNRAWGVGANRTQTVTFDEDGAGPASNVTVFNQDASGTPNYIAYRFTAVPDGAGGALPLTVTFQPASGAGTYHFYGLSNEVATLPTLTVGDASSSTFSGTISGAGRLVKQGAGTLTLEGANTYIGPPDVSAGTLLVHGTHAGGGTYTVAPDATLGGTGSITAPVHLYGAMSPGASVDEFTTGAQTWHDGGSFTLEIDGASGTAGQSPGWDLLTVNGTLDLTGLGPGAFRVDLVSLNGGVAGPLDGFSAAPYSSYYWDFVHADAISGFAAEDFDLDLSAFTAHNAIANSFGTGQFAILQDGNNLVITFTAAVPEPASMALLLAGALGLLAWRRRAA